MLIGMIGDVRSPPPMATPLPILLPRPGEEEIMTLVCGPAPPT